MTTVPEPVVHICGDSMDMWLGPPQPTRPRCRGIRAIPHRERFMKWYVREKVWQCQKCGKTMTWEENTAGDWNAWWRMRWDRFVLMLQREDDARDELRTLLGRFP